MAKQIDIGLTIMGLVYTIFIFIQIGSYNSLASEDVISTSEYFEINRRLIILGSLFLSLLVVLAGWFIIYSFDLIGDWEIKGISPVMPVLGFALIVGSVVCYILAFPISKGLDTVYRNFNAVLSASFLVVGTALITVYSAGNQLLRYIESEIIESDRNAAAGQDYIRKA